MPSLESSGQEQASVHVVVFDRSARDARLLVQAVRSHTRSSQLCIHCASTLDDVTRIAEKGVVAHVLAIGADDPQDKLDGIQLVRMSESGRGPLCRIRSPRTQVIYVSRNIHRALDAYKTIHTYFLMKPVGAAQMSEALNAALDRLGMATDAMLTVRSGRRSNLVASSRISYLESNLRKVTIHADSGDLQCYSSLSVMLEQLPGTFIRCHQSYAVNMTRVDALRDREIILKDGSVIPVSRRMEKEVQGRLLAFLGTRE